MNIQRLIGLEMQVPHNFHPEIAAKMLKQIEQRVPLFDRYMDLLIIESEHHIAAITEVLEHYRVDADTCELVLLPSAEIEKGELYEDYAILTPNDHIFFDLSLTALFSLHAEKLDAEPAPALLQLEENLIGHIKNDNLNIYLIDRQLVDLAVKVAQVYSCTLKWHD